VRKALVFIFTALVAFAIGIGWSGGARACDPQTGQGCNMGNNGNPSNSGGSPPSSGSSTSSSSGVSCSSSGGTTVCSSTGQPSAPTGSQPSTGSDSAPSSGTTTQPGAFTPTAALSGDVPPAGAGVASDVQPVSASTPSDTGSNTGSDAAAGGAVAGGVLLAATATKKDGSGNDPRSPQDTTQFQWRITSSTSYGIAGVINIEVQPLNDDGSGGPSTYLQYVGIGPSLGAGVSNLSDWERFETPTPMHFDNSLDGPKFRGMGCQLSLPSVGLGGRGPGWLNWSGGSGVGIWGMGKHYMNPDGNSIGANLIGVNVGYWHTIGSP